MSTTGLSLHPNPHPQFTELVSVVSTLTTASESGTLDIGVPVTSLAVTLPPDVCGVPGGDGSTCIDACGVTQGDNSTCTDSCGVVHGDGASCLKLQGGFFTCDHADPKNGVRNDRQAIVVRSGGAYPNGITGTYRIAFNGRFTQALTMHATAEDVALKLGQLDTIGSIKVSLNMCDQSRPLCDILVHRAETFTHSTQSPPHPTPQVSLNVTRADPSVTPGPNLYTQHSITTPPPRSAST